LFSLKYESAMLEKNNSLERVRSSWPCQDIASRMFSTGQYLQVDDRPGAISIASGISGTGKLNDRDSILVVAGPKAGKKK
jgi:hypothetical protein